MKGRELRAFLVDRDGPRCHWCRRPTYDPAEVGELADCAATVEHLDTPRIRRHVQPDRAVLACRRCNQDRGCLPVDEWRAVLRYRRVRRAFHLVVGVAGLLWWLPTIAQALAVLAADRMRFRLVLAHARVLQIAGQKDAALRVLDDARRRCERRRRALADRL
ncbi:MAG: hypothetical protein ACRYGP_30195 [Janthinobacterium lividum]